MKLLFLTLLSVVYFTSYSQNLYEYLDRRAQEEIKAGHFHSANEYIDTAIALYPDSALFYYHRGGNYFFVDSLEKAKLNFEIYLDNGPLLMDVYKYYGFTLHGLGELEQAKTNYKKYLNYDSLDVDVIMNLSMIDWKHGDREASKRRIDEYVSSSRQNAIICVGFASFLASENEGELAEHYLTKAVDRMPESPEYLIYRSRFYFETEQKEKSCYDLKKAFELGSYEAGNLFAKLKCFTLIDEDIDRGPPPPQDSSVPPPPRGGR